MLNTILNFLNSIVWSQAMIIFIVAAGLFFSIRLRFVQLRSIPDMAKQVFSKEKSDSGISTFASFCTTMAARIGTGNIAGTAVGVYMGGPGAVFWMWITALLGSADSFVECTLGQLYKKKVDGEYRGGAFYCAEKGLGWKKYGTLLAATTVIAVGFLMPAPQAFTVGQAMQNSMNIPMWVVALVGAVLLAIIIMGGIKRISTFASYFVPFMTLGYIGITMVLLIINAPAVPGVFASIFKSAFGVDAIFGGIFGSAISWGVKRATYSSAAGMGEATPAASAAETSHPVKQGLANAFGVYIDTIIVCTCTAVMILVTDCFNVKGVSDGVNVTGAYVGSGSAKMAGLAETGESGILFAQEAVSTLLGNFGSIFIAFALFFFAFTCILSYYYQSETAISYLFQRDDQAKIRKTAIWITRIAMVALYFFYGVQNSGLVWLAGDVGLGTMVWLNMFMLIFLHPKAVLLLRDYDKQKKAGKDPYFDPDKVGIENVDLWREINKDRIAADKAAGTYEGNA